MVLVVYRVVYGVVYRGVSTEILAASSGPRARAIGTDSRIGLGGLRMELLRSDQTLLRPADRWLYPHRPCFGFL